MARAQATSHGGTRPKIDLERMYETLARSGLMPRGTAKLDPQSKKNNRDEDDKELDEHEGLDEVAGQDKDEEQHRSVAIDEDKELDVDGEHDDEYMEHDEGASEESDEAETISSDLETEGSKQDQIGGEHNDHVKSHQPSEPLTLNQRLSLLRSETFEARIRRKAGLLETRYETKARTLKARDGPEFKTPQLVRWTAPYYTQLETYVPAPAAQLLTFGELVTQSNGGTPIDVGLLSAMRPWEDPEKASRYPRITIDATLRLKLDAFAHIMSWPSLEKIFKINRVRFLSLLRASINSIERELRKDTAGAEVKVHLVLLDDVFSTLLKLEDEDMQESAQVHRLLVWLWMTEPVPARYCAGGDMEINLGQVWRTFREQEVGPAAPARGVALASGSG